jgi:hypothetical protein
VTEIPFEATAEIVGHHGQRSSMESGDCNVGTSSPGVGFVSRDDGMMGRLDMASEQDGLEPRGRVVHEPVPAI